MARVVPTCLALIPCDSVSRTGRSGDPSIVRAFAVFRVRFLPTASPPFSLWIHVTDGNGPTVMDLVIEHVPAGPPGNFPIAEIIPLGHSEPVPPRVRRPRRAQKKKGSHDEAS